MTRDRPPRGITASEITGLSWQQEYQAARLVASSSTDAADCAELLAALGLDAVDGLRSMIAPNGPEVRPGAAPAAYHLPNRAPLTDAGRAR